MRLVATLDSEGTPDESTVYEGMSLTDARGALVLFLEAQDFTSSYTRKILRWWDEKAVIHFNNGLEPEFRIPVGSTLDVWKLWQV